MTSGKTPQNSAITETDTTPSDQNSRTRRIGAWLLSAYFTLAVPVLLTLLTVRLVMTPLYLEVIYRIPGFPEDNFGFTREDRLEHAPPAVNYLINDEPISYLGDQTFPDGSRLYNERELHHMADVQEVTIAAFNVLLAGVLITIVLIFAFWRQAHWRRALISGVFNGAVLTLSLIGTIIVVAVIAWDTFFTSFHQIFFESGTWRFAYSDTLIRLFPEFFWFSAAITIGIVTAIGALVIILLVWRSRFYSK